MKSWKGLRLMLTKTNNAPNMTQCLSCNASPAVLVQSDGGKPICLHCDSKHRQERGEYEWRQWLCELCYSKAAVLYCKMHALATCKICSQCCDSCKHTKDRRITFALGAFKTSPSVQVVSPRQAAACASLLGPVVMEEETMVNRAIEETQSFADMWTEQNGESPATSNTNAQTKLLVRPSGTLSMYFNEPVEALNRGSEESSQTEIGNKYGVFGTVQRDSSTPESQTSVHQQEGHHRAVLQQVQPFFSLQDCSRHSRIMEDDIEQPTRKKRKNETHSHSQEDAAVHEHPWSSDLDAVEGYWPILTETPAESPSALQNRRDALHRYKEKKKNRRYNHRVMYVARMERAHNRTRVKGRFVKEDRDNKCR